MKNVKKPTGLKPHKEPMSAKTKALFSVYIAVVISACCFAVSSFAAGDPLSVINNLSTFIFGLIRAIGLKSYCGVLLEGAVIILACVIFSLYANTPPHVSAALAPVTMVWKYIGELAFNMLVLVGTVKMSDKVIHEMLGF